MFNELLKCINDFIGEYSRGLVDYESDVYKKVKKSYEMICDSHQTNMLYNYIDAQFEEDVQLYSLLYSILLDISKDDEIIKRLYNWLIYEDMDIYLKISLRYQLTCIMFVNNSKSYLYEEKMKLHEALLIEYKKKLGIDVEKVPLSIRNPKKILIVTDQLLGPLHAPSDFVYRIAALLKINYNFDIQVVCMQTVVNKDIYNFWYNGLTSSDCDIEGNYVNKDYGVEIPIYYSPMRENNEEVIKLLFQEIYAMKPAICWYIGGESIAGDLMGQMTTTLSMPCVSGYATSVADYMITCDNIITDNFIKQQQYLTSRNQKLLYLKPVRDLKEGYTVSLKRTDIGAKEEDFLIIVAGNRLEQEITDDIISVLKCMIEKNNKSKIVFVGDIQAKYQEHLNEQLHNKCIMLGFRDDLLDVIALCNLMFNPPRIGGGSVILMACGLGVPVVSLNEGAGAVILGTKMCLNAMEELIESIAKHMNDYNYWLSQSEKAVEIYNEFTKIDFKDYVREMLIEIEKNENYKMLDWDIKENQ